MRFLKKYYNYFLITSINFLLTFVNWVETNDGYGNAWDGNYSIYGIRIPCLLFFILSVIIILVKLKEFVESKKFFIAELSLSVFQLFIILLFIFIIATGNGLYYNIGILSGMVLSISQLIITLKSNKNKGR
ncbi:MAG: hypothetical protein JXB50_12805 [Spirochaetes bacterium]|nr:hypothetical protein [Spirochaetota bacterium]